MSASQQCLEEGWKLYRGSRLEEREQAAMHHLVSPAEATTPALGKEGRKITSELYLHQPGGGWKQDPQLTWNNRILSF